MPSWVECPRCERSLSGSRFLQPKFNVAFPGFLVKQAKLERLAVHALPVPWLALGQPLDSLLEPAGAGRLGLGLIEPVNVFAPIARAELLEGGRGCAVGPQGARQVVGDDQFPGRLLLRLRSGRRFDPILVELHGLLDVTAQDLLRRQVGEFADPSKLTHRLLDLAAALLDDQRTFPETKGAMLLERGHIANHSLVQEVRKAPLHGLFHIRAGLVNDLSEMREDRPGELRGPCDVGVDTIVALSHEILSNPQVERNRASEHSRILRERHALIKAPWPADTNRAKIAPREFSAEAPLTDSLRVAGLPGQR